MMVPLLLLPILFEIASSQNPVCDTARECYDTTDYCDDINCTLTCNATQSCLDLNYKCNSTDPSSTCSIECSAFQSCKNLNIHSIATTTTISCIDWPSCINTNIDCQASTECTRTCDTSSRSCQGGTIITPEIATNTSSTTTIIDNSQLIDTTATPTQCEGADCPTTTEGIYNVHYNYL